jgi:hypothetical protein
VMGMESLVLHHLATLLILPAGRATDAARVARFKKILAAQSVDVGESLFIQPC